jgi:hypothetical protein
MDQSPIKTVSIGVTINLGDYESLRVEVGGEVVRPHDAESIVSYLDEVLARFGRADPRTTAKIDRYREHVLAPPGVEVPQKTLGAAEPGGQASDGAPASTISNTEHIASVGNGVSSGAVCAQCGAEVTRSQAKLAQTLSGRNLCTSCFDEYMKKYRGGSK